MSEEDGKHRPLLSYTFEADSQEQAEEIVQDVVKKQNNNTFYYWRGQRKELPHLHPIDEPPELMDEDKNEYRMFFYIDVQLEKYWHLSKLERICWMVVRSAPVFMDIVEDTLTDDAENEDA